MPDPSDLLDREQFVVYPVEVHKVEGWIVQSMGKGRREHVQRLHAFGMWGQRCRQSAANSRTHLPENPMPTGGRRACVLDARLHDAGNESGIGTCIEQSSVEAKGRDVGSASIGSGRH